MRDEWNSDPGRCSADPAVNMIAAVSLMLRPTDNTMPVQMPGVADGNTTRVTICQRVLPRP